MSRPRPGDALIDHEIAEVWDGSAERWRLVEPEIDDGHTDPADGASFDVLDVPPDRFLTAPRAWQLARSGAVDPERFVTDPDLEIPATRGWPQLRHNLVHDLAALNKTEMLLWEDWGMPDPRTAPGPGSGASPPRSRHWSWCWQTGRWWRVRLRAGPSCSPPRGSAWARSA